MPCATKRETTDFGDEDFLLRAWSFTLACVAIEPCEHQPSKPLKLTVHLRRGITHHRSQSSLLTYMLIHICPGTALWAEKGTASLWALCGHRLWAQGGT